MTKGIIVGENHILNVILEPFHSRAFVHISNVNNHGSNAFLTKFVSISSYLIISIMLAWCIVVWCMYFFQALMSYWKVTYHLEMSHRVFIENSLKCLDCVFFLSDLPGFHYTGIRLCWKVENVNFLYWSMKARVLILHHNDKVSFFVNLAYHSKYLTNPCGIDCYIHD